jgi:hypothetical protein
VGCSHFLTTTFGGGCSCHPDCSAEGQDTQSSDPTDMNCCCCCCHAFILLCIVLLCNGATTSRPVYHTERHIQADRRGQAQGATHHVLTRRILLDSYKGQLAATSADHHQLPAERASERCPAACPTSPPGGGSLRAQQPTARSPGSDLHAACTAFKQSAVHRAHPSTQLAWVGDPTTPLVQQTAPTNRAPDHRGALQLYVTHLPTCGLPTLHTSKLPAVEQHWCMASNTSSTLEHLCNKHTVQG